jgi:hypothetical protein
VNIVIKTVDYQSGYLEDSLSISETELNLALADAAMGMVVAEATISGVWYISPV